MFFRKIVLATFAAGLAATLSAPAFAVSLNAAPLSAPSAGGDLPVLTVDHRRGHGKHGYHGKKRYPYYNGHRGYRNYRRGYRQYNGWWFPPAAFGFGFGYRVIPPQRYIAPPPLVIVPPSYAPPPPYYGPHFSPAHYQWCDRRYRSYRAVDNSFQPYHGPRRACLSPYGP
ncbi:BA14K family protein [Roseibium sediminicola]|uniref:BA14K family protein n=1 Tax=Roseibium sediminicola TaxID=2933272 RepID=UPI0031F33296